MCVNVGHSHPRVIKAIQDQAAALPYASPFMATEVRARLGARLAGICPGDIDAFFFTNGGAEANENAMKIARWLTGRQKILAFYRSYHGGTAGAISATGDPRRWSEPALPGIVHVLNPVSRSRAGLGERRAGARLSGRGDSARRPGNDRRLHHGAGRRHKRRARASGRISGRRACAVRRARHHHDLPTRSCRALAALANGSP